MYGTPLKTNRSLGRFILFTIITFGIYSLVYFYCVGRDLNTINSRYDGKKSMNFILLTLVSPFTAGIASLVWMHRISNRTGWALTHRSINYELNANTFWLWAILGSMIFVGPFVYVHKLSTAMNYICQDYNARGYQ
jgi:magnesium-transporting ATPase (P-type)